MWKFKLCGVNFIVLIHVDCYTNLTNGQQMLSMVNGVTVGFAIARGVFLFS